MSLYLIEDDDAVRDSLVLLLRQLGHDPHAFPDAESFVAEVVPGHADTVIVDLALPGMNGSQLIAWLHALKAPPRVVVITGQPQTKLKKWLGDVPGEHVIRKPLTADTLVPFL